MPFPFEVPFEEIRDHLDDYVDVVFASLHSEFLTLPKGPGFIEYPVFEHGYEALKLATGNFRAMPVEAVLETVYRAPITLIVLRSMLGFTPPEWAYVTTQKTGVEVTQGAIRSIDRKIRMQPERPLRNSDSLTDGRIKALVTTACQLLTDGAPEEPEGVLHRLGKADTRSGLASIRPLSEMGVPYAMLLYERFLGRPFAGHRDSVSELVGDVLEAPIEALLHRNGISYRKTKRAARVERFDQAPDFVIPDEFNPKVVIEAKLTEDDGTARDKVTRVQHLGALSMQGQSPEQEPKFEVIACIAGRGFKVRREDMKKLLVSTRGKVFTLENIPKMIEFTNLLQYKSEP